MSKVQYNYIPDRLASPKAPWIDEPAAVSTVYQPSVQDPHFPLAAYLTRMQSCYTRRSMFNSEEKLRFCK